MQVQRVQIRMYRTPRYYLPPSLQPLPNKPCLPILLITIVDIAYLEILPAQKPTTIKYKWWGLKNEQFDHPLHESIHQFFISVSQQMFIRYCMDMKVLEFELCDRVGKVITKGHFNFSLLSGWHGQPYSTVCDLKNCKNTSKIGEIEFKIQLSSAENPALENVNPTLGQNQPNFPAYSKSKNNGNKINQKNNNNQHKFMDNHQSSLGIQMPLKKKSRIQNELEMPQQKAISASNIHLNGQNKMIKSPLIEQTKMKSGKKNRLPQSSQCICEHIRPNKFAIEKLRLKQEVEMFFNSATEYSSEQINFQALGWQPESKIDENLACKLTIPVLDQGSNVYQNQYSLGRGKGIIRVAIKTSNHSEEQIKNYLIKNKIEIKIGAYQGTVPLFQVAGSRGETIRVEVYDKKNKKQVLKGYFLIKLVSPTKKKAEDDTKQSHKAHVNQEQDMAKKQRLLNEESNYIWLYLSQLHFLEPIHWQDSNIFAIVRSGEKEMRTKTVWGNQAPLFNQIVTIKMPKNALVIEFWNRKRSDRLIGKAQIRPNQIKQYGVEIPIEDQYGRVQGYINLCVGKGDIMAATQFLNTHAKAFYHQSPLHPPTRPLNEQPNQSKQHQDVFLQPISSQKPGRSQRNSIEQSEQSNYSVEPQLPRIIEEEELDFLQIHNQIFTCYLTKECDWLNTYRNRFPSLAQFLLLAKPIISSNLNITKLASIYLNSQENTIKLDQIQQSLQSFKVYYDIIWRERDQTILRALQFLNQEGITINQVERKLANVSSKVRSQPSFPWKQLKQFLSANIVERLRFYYQTLGSEQLCDQFRKFEVYETTSGQQVGIDILKRQVYSEICEVLGIDPHTQSLKQSIRQAGLELSKFELMCLFDELPRDEGNKMVKSPTFGFLATDRVPKPVPLQDNSSLAFNLERQELRNLSQKFGNPNISPINQNGDRHKKSMRIGFKDLVEFVKCASVNGRKISFRTEVANQFVEVAIDRAFNFQGHIETAKNGILEFQGPINEWIALVDDVGQYCGCVIFQ